MMYFDTHAHLTSEQLLPHVPALLERAAQAHVQTIVNICTDPHSLSAGLLINSVSPRVFNAAATVPHDVEAEGESFFPIVEEAARSKKLVAIGETGLDYFYEHSKKQIQQLFLSRYFALAKSVQLPLIFHCREAFADLFAMADEQYASHPALLHCFTGTLEEAKAVLDRGWLISLSGIITFKKSEALREIARYVPLDRLVIETDSPYLAPHSRRGEQNEPSFLPETAQLIASVKGLDLVDVATSTTANAIHFFSLPKVSLGCKTKSSN